MEYKVAIVVDWENIRKKVFENLDIRKQTNCIMDYNKNVSKIPEFLISFLENDKKFPYRIFIYTAEPLKDVRKKPNGNEYDFSKSPVTLKSKSFIEKISLCNLVAMRKGRLSFKGWDTKNKPIIVQKKVDMLMGLDIAHLAYKKLVDRVLVFSYDLDIQPALKIARLEGLQVILPMFEEIGTNEIPTELPTSSNHYISPSFFFHNSIIYHIIPKTLKCSAY